MITYEEALVRIAKSRGLQPIDQVPIREAFGNVLAEDIDLPEDLPLFNNSAMDGYAVRASDIQGATETDPLVLECQGIVGAGEDSKKVVEAGTCLKIMTGAPIPPGADSVVPVEHVQVESDRLLFSRPVEPGACIRKRGEEMRAGERLIDKGTRIDGVVWGLLATANRSQVPVYRKPRVAMLVTGNELTEPGEELKPGSIRNSNGFTLRGVLEDLGVEVMDLGVGRDDREDLLEKLKRGLEADVLITVGGVSAGDFDHIRDLLAEGALGFKELFYKIRIRPGKPVRCGMMGETLLIGLPGNPVSCLVGYHLFVKPALRKMWGFRDWENPVYKAILRGEVHSPAPVLNFWRGTLFPAMEPGLWEAIPKEKAGSGMLTTFLGANGFILVPIETDRLADGDPVDFIPIEGG